MTNASLSPDLPPYDFRHLSNRYPTAAKLRLWNNQWRDCRKCPQCTAAAYGSVTGEGCAASKTLFIGEAPGAVELTWSRPFIGRAGRLLRYGLLGEDICKQIFLTNILACRPPQNRNPETEEIANCLPRLQALLTILQPRRIFVIGRIAEASFELLNTDYEPTFLYHPAFLLRNGVTVEQLQHPDDSHCWGSNKIATILGDYREVAKMIKQDNMKGKPHGVKTRST